VVGAIATVAGPAVLGATVKAVEAGMELDSAETRQRKAGISEDEMKQAKAIILHQKTLWPGLSLSGMDDVYIKERSITNSPKEAQQMLPIFAKAMSALGDDAAGMGLMVKAAQTLGAALDPGRFARFMDAYIKAKSVHSDLLSPEEMLSFFRGLKASGALLSDRFLHSTGMSLAAEMKGKQGGGGLNELIQTFVNPTSAEARAFQKIGLMSKDDFKPPTPHGGFGKGFGHVSGEKEGKVKSGAHAHVAGAGPNDWKLWETDPDLAMNKYLLPALIAQGITKQDEQIEWAQANLKPGAAAVFTNLLTKDEEHKADAERMFAAPGFEAAEINAKDATIQLKGLRQELWDTLAVMTSPAMLQAATTMHSISKSIAEWSEWINAWQEKHPTAAPYASAGGIAGGLAAGGAAGLLLAVKALRFIKGLSGGVAAGEAAAAPGAGGGLTGWAAGLGIPAAAAYAGTHLTPAEQAIQDEMQRRQSAGEPEPTHGTFNSWDEILRRIKEELPGGGGMGTGYRIPAPTGSPFSPQAPFFQLPSIDTRSADAEAAGERFGAAFRQGVATGLNGAYFDTHSTIDKIIAMMTFGASPSIKPTGGDIWTSGTTGITANGIFSDSGVAPMR
jgi:hypothetical protein